MAMPHHDIYIYSSFVLCLLTLLLNWLIPWWQGRRLSASLRQLAQLGQLGQLGQHEDNPST